MNRNTESMHRDSSKKSIYRMSWFDFLDKGELNRTIRSGIIFYVVIAVLAIPSALCSQQQTVLVFKIPRGAAIDFILNQTDHMDARLANNDICPEQLDQLATLNRDISPYHDHIMQAADLYEVDPALIRAIIVAESSNNPEAVSHRGAQGLMQLMPTTAKWLGVEDSFDPAMNIDGGARYIRQLLDRFDGDISLALAAYNAGSRYVHKYGGVPPFRATKNYIKKVLYFQTKFQDELATFCVNIDPAV